MSLLQPRVGNETCPFLMLIKKKLVLGYFLKRSLFCSIFFKKALTVLRGPLAYPNGLLDLHIPGVSKKYIHTLSLSNYHVY
jgi:hypothetical protein